jgi:hypothetical protein
MMFTKMRRLLAVSSHTFVANKFQVFLRNQRHVDEIEVATTVDSSCDAVCLTTYRQTFNRVRSLGRQHLPATAILCFKTSRELSIPASCSVTRLHYLKSKLVGVEQFRGLICCSTLLALYRPPPLIAFTRGVSCAGNTLTFPTSQ